MRISLIILFLIFLSLELTAQISPLKQYGQIDQGIAFVENVGQFRTFDGKPATDVLYKAQVSGGEIYVRKNGISFVLTKTEQTSRRPKHDEDRMLSPENMPEPGRYTLSKTEMNFFGAGTNTEVTALEPLESYTNYYIGREEFTNVRSYRKIIIKNVYDKIDFAIYSNTKNEPEYDFIVHPGGNPNDIALEFTDHEGIRITDSNSIVIGNKLGTIEHIQPISYQTNTGGIKRVLSQYNISGNKVKFEIPEYDRQNQLIIDPIIRIWCLSFSGKEDEYVKDVEIDHDGNVILTGWTLSIDLKVLNAFQNSFASIKGGEGDGFLAKFDKNGKKLWATYVGGEKGDFPSSLAIDNNNNIIMGGWTASFNFYTTKFQKVKPSKNTYNCFLLNISQEGTLLWGTYLGGDHGEFLYDIALDKNDNIYCVGWTDSENFFNSFNSKKREYIDAYVLKLSKDCELKWSRILQGNYWDEAKNIALDSLGNVYIVGETCSYYLSGTSQTRTDSIRTDIFYAKLDTNGDLFWVKILIGNGFERVHDIQVNSLNEAIIAGTSSSTDIYLNGFQRKKSDDHGSDSFILFLDSLGRINWGTFISTQGWSWETIKSFAVDRFNNLYLTGYFGGKLNYPVEPIEKDHGLEDVMLMKINPKKEIEWFTYFGNTGGEFDEQIDIDDQDNMYIGFRTESLINFDFGDLGRIPGYNVGIVKFQYKLTVPGKLTGFCEKQQHGIPFLLNIKPDTLLTFTAQISDTFNLFKNPIEIGKLKTDTSGAIVVEIPQGLNLNRVYMLRIICSDTTIKYTYPELMKISSAPETEITGDANPCQKNPAEYTVSLSDKDYYFIWSSEGGKIKVNGNKNVEIEFDSAATNNIEVTVRNIKTGCEQTFSKEVSVRKGPEISIDNPPAICEGSPDYKLNEGNPKGGEYSGTYVVDGYFKVKNAGPGLHYVKYSYTDTNGCYSTELYVILILEKPEKPTITRQENDLISSYEKGNQWYFNDIIIQGATGKVLTLTNTGNYSVQVTDSNQCTSYMSDIYSVEAGIEDIQSEIIIRPNPANDRLNIELIKSDIYYSEEKIRITDIMGREYFNFQLINVKTEIDITSLPSGIYLIQIDTYIRKFIKM